MIGCIHYNWMCCSGTGKTHTMLGSDEEPGIMVHTLNSLFRRMEETSNDKIYTVSIGYLEVWKKDLTVSKLIVSLQSDIFKPKHTIFLIHFIFVIIIIIIIIIIIVYCRRLKAFCNILIVYQLCPLHAGNLLKRNQKYCNSKAVLI